MTNAIPSDLRHRLRALRRELRSDVDRLRDLRAVAARSDALDELLEDLDRQLERVGRAPVITLIGATGAGKSTMLNALAGSAIAVEGVDRPTTRYPVVYAPRDADVGELVGAEVERPHGHDSEGRVQVVRYDGASGPWTAQILVDAPDMNSIDAQHRATVTALAERSDVLVVVLHRQSVVEEAAVSFVDAFAGRRQLLFVLNRADELTPQATAELLAQVRQLAATRWQAAQAPVLATSARAAQGNPDTPGWQEFCAALRALELDSAVTGVRRWNAVGTAARIESLFGEIDGEVRGEIELLPGEAQAGMSRLVERCADEVSRRLALRRADLRELLWGEAAKRWDGPGGWALRAGGIGSLGLGSAAALATRNPLLAAGAAAGALATEQVQRAVRDRRVADATGLMPAASDFAAWYGESLAGARMRAARLTGSTEGLGLPSGSDAHASAELAVAEAWRDLLDSELPAAAERSALRYFRAVLDLPVYALAAWVAYQVGSGFFAGDYAGVDFLLSAALILAAYLFAVRFVVRRGLGWTAQRLLRGVIAAARRALARQVEEAQQAMLRVQAERTSVLDRLVSLTVHWRTGLGG